MPSPLTPRIEQTYIAYLLEVLLALTTTSSRLFGAVLLTTEKTEDFEWTFRTFVDLMGGVAPLTILTGSEKFHLFLQFYINMLHLDLSSSLYL
jgi:hypothetical protein